MQSRTKGQAPSWERKAPEHACIKSHYARHGMDTLSGVHMHDMGACCVRHCPALMHQLMNT